tara:strand:+ start:53 stop:766 length:714 start_codon:yes stop_codon:yes gene_type:complete
LKKIVIIIPTYNEKENIFKLTKEILKFIPKSKIFIIDDTKKINLKKYFKDKRIKYFLRKNKKGRGSAVLYGFKKALKNNSHKIFIEMDADFSHDPKELKYKIKFFLEKKIDLLISSRYLKGSKIKNWSFFRLIFSRLSNILADFLLNLGISDYTNGFRIYSKRSIKQITKKCGRIGDGFIVLSEILLIIKLSNFKIYELPTIFINRKRGESSVNLRLILQSLKGLMNLYFIKRRHDR